MKENKNIIIFTIIFVVVSVVVYKVSTFSLFDEPNSELTEIVVPNRDYKLKLFFVPSNATSQDYIQVRKTKGDRESVIHNYERYDTVVSHSIKGDMLRLILKNNHLNNNVQDTIYLKLD